jgi:non-specific serine/threonine protein kinase
VPGAVATALGLQESGEITLEDTLVAFLHTKQLLLILDNCEHLVDASAQLVVHLLAHCPDLHILATSREALGVPGETPLRVAPLHLPQAEEVDVETLSQAEAVQLFVERATESYREFSLNADSALAVREICRRLDGIPLALELAARWVQTLQVEQVAERLNDAFRLLTGGQRTALPRQQTLRATLDWSYNLLSATEKAVLRRLAVFAGGWELEAAEAVCCDANVDVVDVLQILTQLVGKSLVEVNRKSGQQTRYHLLETVRQYAQEKLGDAGEIASTRDDHMSWFAALAERAEPQLYGQGQMRWLRRLETEHDNLRGALSWALGEGDAEIALQLSGALGRFWRIRGYWREGRRWLEAALALEAETGETTALHWSARAYLGTGMVSGYTKRSAPYFRTALRLYQATGDQYGVSRTIPWLVLETWGEGDKGFSWQGRLEESLAFLQEIDDQIGIGWCYFAFGMLKKHSGDMQAGRDLYERGLAHQRAAGDLETMGYTLSELAWFVWDDGDLLSAQVMMEEALQLHRVLGSQVGICHNLRHLAVFAAFQGDYMRSKKLAEEGVTAAREIGVTGLLGVCMAVLGQYGFFCKGEIQQAQTCIEEALNLGRETGHMRSLMLALSFLGNIHRRQDDLGKAEKMMEECSQRLHARPIASGMWRLEMYKGDLARAQGDYARAEAFYRESLQMIEKRGRRLPDVPSCIDGLGMVAALQGHHPKRGAQLFGAAQALRDRMGMVIHPVDQAEYDQHLTLLRGALDDASFTAAWETGLAMDADQAIAYALEKDN